MVVVEVAEGERGGELVGGVGKEGGGGSSGGGSSRSHSARGQ